MYLVNWIVGAIMLFVNILVIWLWSADNNQKHYLIFGCYSKVDWFLGTIFTTYILLNKNSYY